MSDEEDFKTVDDLTPKEWKDIRRIYVAIRSSGKYAKDPVKCASAAFVQWLANQPELRLGVPFEEETLH